MDRLHAMSVFVTVAELHGFAPAARRLRLSPSAVTRFVANLEDVLGARLLQRTTRSVTLTDAGTRYLERARRILADVTEAEGAARKERTVPTGRLVIAAPNMFGRLHVAPVMSSFLEKHPSVTGELLLGDRVANLIEDGIDLAVRIGVLEDSTHVARTVGSTRRVIVAAPKYLARRKKINAPGDLVGHSIIHFSGVAPRQEWRFEDHRFSFTPTYSTNSADAAIGHAERGGGVTMALFYQVEEAVRRKRLRVLLADFEAQPLPIHLVYPTTRLLSAKVRAFVDLVTSTAKWKFE